MDKLNEMDVDQALIYPNPVEGELTIQAEGLQRVVVYNVMGQQVAAVETKEPECTLNMDAYPKGLYMLRLVTRNGVLTRNVLVQ